MKTSLFSGLLPGVLAFYTWLLASMLAPPAYGQEVQNVLGAYSGSIQQVGNPDLIPGIAELEVTSQSRRRFEGVFIVDEDLPEEILVQGTVSASGNVSANDPEGSSIIVHYRLEQFDLGAAILGGSTKFVGERDQPIYSAVLLRDFPLDPENPPPEDADGDWNGEARSFADGHVRIWRLQSERRSSTGYSNRLTIFDPEAEAIIIDGGRSTFSGDDDMVMIGAAAGLELRVVARYLAPTLEPAEPQARIEGFYELVSPGGEEGPHPERSGLGGPDTVVDFGSFVLTQMAVNPVPEPR